MKFLSRQGVTLVEIMLTVAILTLMSAGLISAFLAGRSAWSVNEASAVVQNDVRNALWSMTRDLRQAQGLYFIQKPESVTMTFAHPSEGTVAYSWDNVSKQITRKVNGKDRVIARNITVFIVTEHGTSMDIQITGTQVSTNKKTITLTLKGKVVFR